jgi:diguanylate cyclase (GGDEF)-like protein/PAS domain S-box-containing protein
MNTEDFYKQMLDNMHDGVYFVDRDRVITYWNKGAERITGYKAEQVIGRQCRANILNHVGADGKPLCLTDCPLSLAMDRGKVQEAEAFLHHADGHRLPVTMQASPIHTDKGEVTGAVETFRNNSQLVESRRQLYHLRKAALLDPLTQVANRRFLDLRLWSMLEEYRQSSVPFGVFMCDVDDFKGINDTNGHDVGDRVLRMVTRTMQATLRQTDIVGRWGGDEIICLLPEVDLHGLRAVSEKLCRIVEAARLDVDHQSIIARISCGCTLAQQDDTVESILKRADQLMYQSKFNGGNRVTSSDVQ